MRTPPRRLAGLAPEPPPVSAVPPVPARLALPPAGPPYDDQDPSLLPPASAAALPPAGPAAPAGLDGPGASMAPDGGPDLRGAAGRDRRATPASAGAGAGLAGDPHASGWTTVLAQGLAEALAGSRAPRQLAPWTTEQARRRIRQLGPLLPSGQRPVVRRVLTSAPRRDVVEMTVIVGIGPLTRAIAVRLERAPADPGRPGRGRPWLCTAIEAA
jgi:hypothetical protein